jgi:hypothetical protein
MNRVACGANRSDRINQVNVKMKAVVRLLEHAFDSKIWQIEQFRDSLESHRVYPLCHGSVGKQNLNKVGEIRCFFFFRRSRALVDFQLFCE